MNRWFYSILFLFLLPLAAWAEGELGPPIPKATTSEEAKPLASEQKPRQAAEEKVLAVVYVTDNLVLGMKDNPEGTGKNLKLLRSGARLEVLERQGAFSKVRTSEGVVGWAKSTFMIKDKPAILLVEDMKQEIKSLQAEIKQLKKGDKKELEKVVEVKIDPQQKQRIVELELALDEARKQLSEQDNNIPQHEALPEPSESRTLTVKVLFIVLLIGVLSGAGITTYYFNKRMRRRFAGLKV